MGEVYRAHDTRLGRTVAIKVLPVELTQDPTARQRFEREARAAAALAHPHICRLLDIGRERDVDFLVMEYLEGETLAARLQRGKLPLGDCSCARPPDCGGPCRRTPRRHRPPRPQARQHHAGP